MKIYQHSWYWYAISALWCLFICLLERHPKQKHFIFNHGFVLFFKIGLLRKQSWKNDFNYYSVAAILYFYFEELCSRYTIQCSSYYYQTNRIHFKYLCCYHFSFIFSSENSKWHLKKLISWQLRNTGGSPGKL